MARVKMTQRKKFEHIDIPEFESDEEREKFVSLRKEISHLMMPVVVRKMQIRQKIDNLAEKFLTDEWINIQRDYEFSKILKPDGTYKKLMDEIDEMGPDQDTYKIVPLENRWGDYVLFKKIKKYGDD